MRIVFVLLAVMASQAAFSQAWRGCDVSFLPEMEGDGVIYQDPSGAAIEAPRAWMSEQGVNLVRLRVWHNPSPRLRSSCLEVIEEATKWHDLGVPILLDFHFSDTWADPAHQDPPSAWQGQGFEEVQSSMTCWLHCVLEALHVRGIEPAMVQLGNEIDPGMMLPHGSIENGFGPLADLLAAGHDVVSEVFPIARWPFTFRAWTSHHGISRCLLKQGTRRTWWQSVSTANGIFRASRTFQTPLRP